MRERQTPILEILNTAMGDTNINLAGTDLWERTQVDPTTLKVWPTISTNAQTLH